MKSIVLFILTLIGISFASPSLRAQESGLPGGLLARDDAVVTGFSGTVERAGKPFIDTDGKSVRIFALKNAGPLNARLLRPEVKLEVPAALTGQVFGVALDRMFPANAYVAATAAYGLHIMAPDADGDGTPEIIRKGRPGATWMEGQWGPGGGPGSIWKIEGATGQVRLFANLPVGAAALGQIAFDPLHYQLFVSDRDAGLIYRLDMNGNVLDTWDHGQTGRPAAGLDAVADDGVQADITSPDFDIENPNTWGLTDVRRRIWGLAVHDGRLYYAVAEGPQVWSVSIDPATGALGADARIEIAEVPGGMEVSDITFDTRGRLYLAQRGTAVNSVEMTAFHVSGANRVMRYRRDPQTGAWIQDPAANAPEEYAIGFPRPYQNAAGGIALSCSGLLWSTGDNLRNDPVVLPAGPYAVHGLQGNPLHMTRPRNEPPFATVFVDYDGQFGDMRNVGHVGDVDIYRDCAATPVPGHFTPPPGWTPPWQTPFPVPYKRGLVCQRDAESGDWLCDYEIRVVNWGAGVFAGPLVIWDEPAAGVSFEALLEGSVGFTCTQPGGPGSRIRCEAEASLRLDLLASAWLRLRTRIPADAPLAAFDNCVIIGEDGLVRDCASVPVPEPRLVPEKLRSRCERDLIEGGIICRYLLGVTNAGGAAYTGRPSITDDVGTGVVLIGDNDGTGPDGALSWSCAQPGGAGGDIVCSTDDAITLDPGERADVEITVRIPEDAEEDAYRDCALIEAGGERACVDDRAPRLEHEKFTRACQRVDGGIQCAYFIRVINAGLAPYTGPLHVVDHPGPEVTFLGAGATLISWTCNQPGGPGSDITCDSDAPATLGMGESALLILYVFIPDGAPEEAYTNCLLMEEGGVTSCVQTPSNEQPWVVSDKRAIGCEQAEGGWQCQVELIATNTGLGPFTGPLTLFDYVGDGVVFVGNADPAQWSCSQPSGAGGTISCNTNAPVTIPVGGSVSEVITIFIPEGAPAEAYTDCVRVSLMDVPACVTISPEAMQPSKRPSMRLEKSDARCRKEGHSYLCTHRITLTNTGQSAYTGTLSVNDLVHPSAQVVAYSGSVAWQSCAKTGSATIHCESAPVTLAAGASATLLLTVRYDAAAMEKRGALRNCAIGGVGDAQGGQGGSGSTGFELLGRVMPQGNAIRTGDEEPPADLCARVRLAAGKGCDCAEGKPQPKRPVCPPGWTTYPAGTQPPRGWQTQTLGEGAAAIICARPVVTPQPPIGGIVPPAGPKCRKDEFRIPYKDIRLWQKRGYRVRKVQRGRVVIWCARPRKAVVCPPGWQPLDPGIVPLRKKQGWQVRRLSKTLWCGIKPVLPACPRGYKPVPANEVPALRKKGWRLMQIAPGRWCGIKPVLPTCPRGYKPVPANEVPALRKKGWRLMQIAPGRWCGIKPVLPTCPRGYKPVPANEVPALRKKGWRLMQIAPGRWCGIKPVLPACPLGYKPVPANEVPALRKKGWRLKQIAPGRWCGQPGVKPCPPGMHRVKDRCVPIVKPCPQGMQRLNNRCVPIVKPCPPGMVRKGGVCRPVKPPKPPVVKPCPKGMKRLGNRCVPIAKPKPPQPKPCGKGMVRVRGKCVPVRPKPQAKPCPKGLVKVRGRCVRPQSSRPRPSCPKGQVLRKGRCVATRPAQPARPPVRKQPQIMVPQLK